MKLYIKYMVSLRCKIVVKSVLDKLGLQYQSIGLGEVEMNNDITAQKQDLLKRALQGYGLELMEDHKSILIEQIKNVIVEMVHYQDELPIVKTSVYISDKLHHSYNYLSNIFVAETGCTIEHYIIMHKVERIKELIIYEDLSLTTIADKLNYSSLPHMSLQFKKITGISPSYFRMMKHNTLVPLENV